MRKPAYSALAIMLAATVATAARADDTLRIVDEGMNRSQVMTMAHELIDDIGPRLTNSTNMRRAQQWAIAKFNALGLSNVHQESYPFGRGWDLIDSSARLTSPRPIKLTAIPVAWTPPTNGPLSAGIVVAPMRGPQDFAAWRGKLKGKIVLISLPGEVAETADPPFRRLSGDDIAKRDSYAQPHFDPDEPNEWMKFVDTMRQIDRFAAEEGAVALISKNGRDGALVSGAGYQHWVGDTPKLPRFDMAAEDYRRLARFAKMGDNPIVQLDSQVRFLDDDHNAYNVLADLPGTDPKAGYVMAGAHFDSWVAGDGASDNGAGSVVIMEAARILKRLGVRPKRTIRFALWTGEEQEYFGSAEYVQKHVAARPELRYPSGPLNWERMVGQYPVTPLADYGRLKAYFNMDNGSGKIRGFYAEGNAAAVPLLSEWLSPFASMGASSVVAGKEDGTDHVVFQAVGVPGFEVIQDPLDYGSRVHHTNLDTLDHMKAEDLRQAAVVLAGVLLAAANSDRELPRPPLPSQPTATDPFKVDYPEAK